MGILYNDLETLFEGHGVRTEQIYSSDDCEVAYVQARFPKTLTPFAVMCELGVDFNSADHVGKCIAMRRVVPPPGVLSQRHQDFQGTVDNDPYAATMMVGESDAGILTAYALEETASKDAEFLEMYRLQSLADRLAPTPILVQSEGTMLCNGQFFKLLEHDVAVQFHIVVEHADLVRNPQFVEQTVFRKRLAVYAAFDRSAAYTIESVERAQARFEAAKAAIQLTQEGKQKYTALSLQYLSAFDAANAEGDDATVRDDLKKNTNQLFGALDSLALATDQCVFEIGLAMGRLEQKTRELERIAAEIA